MVVLSDDYQLSYIKMDHSRLVGYSVCRNIKVQHVLLVFSNPLEWCILIGIVMS